MTICGAKNRQGQPCKRPAGWGTDHAGSGKCKLHGGKSLRGMDSPSFKHGRDSIYKNYLSDTIKTKVESFSDADPFDLQDELSLSRALLTEYLERFQYVNLTMADIGFMSSLIADITRVAEKITKIKNDNTLTAAEVQYLQVRAVNVALKYFPEDKEKQEQFILDLFGIDDGNSVGYSQLIEGKANSAR